MFVALQQDVFGAIIWMVVLFGFFIMYPRLMLSQAIWQLEQSARKLEAMSDRANVLATKKSGNRNAKKDIDRFTEFFVIEPSSLDPFGIVRKIDQLIRQTENRFHEFTDSIAKGKSWQEKRELDYALRAAIGLKQLAKIVRHFVEMSKKFKNWQLALLIRMQMPLIEKIAEGEFKGAQAFMNGWPVGDSIGPLIAVSFLKKSKPIAEDVVAGEETIEGRRCVILKASGPVPSLGRIDEAIERIFKKHKIAHVVTIDAAQKLEGEKSGSVAEGVGFAMGGIGQREIIENTLLPKKMPIDSIAIKVGMEEAIMPMLMGIYNAVQEGQEAVKRSVRRVPKGKKILVIGVGNSCGIPNDNKNLDSVKKIVQKLNAKMIKEEKESKKGGWF
ncbi:MAG: DUF1512 family protein [Candidatus Aenigmarchaeota archaeon]|nr:DUF1512 family protein [Candidatus Aenigmarchaeota archaeon]